VRWRHGSAASVVFGGEFDQADDVGVELADVVGRHPVLGDVPPADPMDLVTVEEFGIGQVSWLSKAAKL